MALPFCCWFFCFHVVKSLISILPILCVSETLIHFSTRNSLPFQIYKLWFIFAARKRWKSEIKATVQWLFSVITLHAVVLIAVLIGNYLRLINIDYFWELSTLRKLIGENVNRTDISGTYHFSFVGEYRISTPLIWHSQWLNKRVEYFKATDLQTVLKAIQSEEDIIHQDQYLSNASDDV